MENTNSGKNVPEKKFSTGVVSATIWKNNGVSRAGQPTEFRTITLQRRYNKEGEWKSTNSLSQLYEIFISVTSYQLTIIISINSYQLSMQVIKSC